MAYSDKKKMTENGPILCYFCGKPIEKFSGQDADSHILHHKDGDHKNWRISNLANSHRDCHQSYHATSWWDSLPIPKRETMIEAAKENLEIFRVNNKGFLKGRKLSDEHKKNISNAKKKLWAEMSKKERREKREQLRPFFAASPMNKKGRPPHPSDFGGKLNWSSERQRQRALKRWRGSVSIQR